MMTVVLLATMLVIAIGATDILNQSLRSSAVSGRSTVAYLAAESGAERVLWYAVNDAGFEDNFSACSVGGAVDIHDEQNFTCGSYNHLIDPANVNYYYTVRYEYASPYHIYEAIGHFYEAQRSVEMRYAK